ncbi:MAG: tyrosine-type recombinase/integrase [Veillonellaceae bacterium]|nr:tyrosine-type recombinase/integrase [Veillonellaceae bacterium]
MPEDDALACPVFPRRHHLREPERLPRPVQEEDLREFFAVIDNARDLAMFTLMLRCGLRISEIAKLALSDLYLNEETPRMLVRGKGARQRVAYLSDQAVRVLQEYLSTRPTVTSDYVFLSYQMNGLTTHSIHMRLLHYRELAGLTLTCHRLRHSFANDLLNADVPITSIQKLMGHRWIETTQTYVQANDRQVQADLLVASHKLQGWA